MIYTNVIHYVEALIEFNLFIEDQKLGAFAVCAAMQFSQISQPLYTSILDNIKNKFLACSDIYV